MIIGEHWKKECTDRKSCLLPYFAGVQYQQTGSRQLTKKKVNKHFSVVSVSLSELASRTEKAKTVKQTTTKTGHQKGHHLCCDVCTQTHRNRFIGLRHHRSLDDDLTSLLLKKCVWAIFQLERVVFKLCVVYFYFDDDHQRCHTTLHFNGSCVARKKRNSQSLYRTKLERKVVLQLMYGWWENRVFTACVPAVRNWKLPLAN